MDATYAPQSPDLSSFLSGTSPQKQQQQQHQQLQSSAPSTSYAPRSPNLQPFAQLSSSSPQQAPPSRNSAFAAYQQPSRVNQPYGIYDDTLQGQAQQYPIPPLPPGHDFASQQSYQNQQLYSPQTQHFSTLKQEPIYDPRADFGQYPSLNPAYGNQGLGIGSVEDMSGRGKRGAGGAGVKAENGLENRGLGPSMGIDVKTKFPVARIKRIMQADEEVGKVAQVTPVAVSKALELFMISLVTKSADLAKTAGSKRVTAQHLKKAIDADEQFDFLSEITSKVVEGPEAGGKRVKDDDDSDDEAEAKPKKARGRKKKE